VSSIASKINLFEGVFIRVTSNKLEKLAEFKHIAKRRRRY